MRARRYALYGVLIGIAFLSVGTLLQAILDGGEGGLAARIGRAQSMPITWLVDLAPFVLGLLAGLLGTREDLSREYEDENCARLEKAASALYSGAQTLVSSVTSFSGLTAQTAASIRESTTSVRQLTENAARARENAEKVVGLANSSKKRSQEGLQEINESADELLRLTEEVRGLAGDVGGINDRMRSIVEMASAMNHLGERFENLADSAAEEMAQAPSEFPLSLHFIVSEMRRQGRDARNGATLVQGIVAELQRAMAATVAAAENGVCRAERGAHIADQIGDNINQMSEALEASANAAAEIASIARQQDQGIDVLVRAMNQAYHATEEATVSTERVAQEARGLHKLASDFRVFLRVGVEHWQPSPPPPQALPLLTGEPS